MACSYNEAMRNRPFNLAIETSGCSGSVTLGRGDRIIASAELPRKRRHNVDLIPAMDRLCQAHRAAPASMGELYVSLGPGSFTGLRVAVTTVKVLALAGKIPIIGVPTLEVVARNALGAPYDAAHAAVCLNVKHDRAYSSIFERRGQAMVAVAEPALRTMAQLLALAPRPVLILGGPPPPASEDLRDGVRLLPPAFAVARSEAVWHLGRVMARQGRFADPQQLVPLYVRRPEATELWLQRHGPPPSSAWPVGPEVVR